MPQTLNVSSVQLGVVPTHLKFVGGLVPDEQGNLPRNEAGVLQVVAGMEAVCRDSPIPVSCVQIPYFPGIDDTMVAEMVNGLKALDLEVHFIMMVGGGDPMNPADEDLVAEMLISGLRAARDHGIKHVSSTSLEAWMQPEAGEKTGAEYTAAVAQLARLHSRAVNEADIEGSSIEAWHLEFLRRGEFQTFTDLKRVNDVIEASNQQLGRVFFKALVDAAHCGDSQYSIAENQSLIRGMAEAGTMGIFHASAKTTRGCFSTDDGWIAALLASAAGTGKLEHVFVEYFHHEDAALAGLRELDPGHGIDTTDGRSYHQLVLDGLSEMGHRLNNLANRGILAD